MQAQPFKLNVTAVASAYFTRRRPFLKLWGFTVAMSSFTAIDHCALVFVSRVGQGYYRQERGVISTARESSPPYHRDDLRASPSRMRGFSGDIVTNFSSANKSVVAPPVHS